VAEEVKRFYLETFIDVSKQNELCLTPLFNNLTEAPEVDDISGVMATRVMLENIPLANTDESDWEQILDFRKDEDRVTKIRGIRRLYRKLSTANSEQEAQDILCDALEQYRLSSEHHGFTLKKGILELFLDKQTIMASLVSGAFIGSLTAAGAAGAICILGNSYLKVRDSKIKKKQLLINPGGEAALIYDIQKLFGNNGSK
jgi:hypothetical protein